MKNQASLLALLGYGVLSFAYFGVHVVSHPTRSYIGYLSDPEIFIWSFAWWPHALGEAKDPFITNAIWAPNGFNLAWTATAPGLALLFTPLTLAVGPIAAYNVAVVLMPALAAWTAFLLCRHITRSVWPSLVGGYLFGFSSYMLGHILGHLQITSIFLLPLIALVLLRYLEGELDRRALVLRLGPMLAAEVWFSLEVSFTLVLAIAVSLALAFACEPTLRARLWSLLQPLAAAYAVAAALAAPLIYHLFAAFSSNPVNGAADATVEDLANFAIPTHLVLLSGRVASSLEDAFPSNVSERTAYVGIPALLVVAWFARRRVGVASGRFLLASLGVTVLFSLGSRLYVDGHDVVPLPWRLVSGLPVVDNVEAGRFTLYTSLVVAVIVAATAASSRSPWLRFVLPAACVLVLVPRPAAQGAWHGTPDYPAFFADGTYRFCLAKGENVIVLPYGPLGDGQVWQARTGFWFRQAEGYVTPTVPSSFADYNAALEFFHGDAPLGGAADVLALAKAKDVGAILIDEAQPDPWRSFVEGIATPISIDGLLVYPLQPLPPGCTYA